jgi:DeoR/GlpR family transcriptional regulator of sugar metabolism
MNSKQCRAGIHEAILTGRASFNELARRFGVSPSTIRRDPALLTGAGQLVRTYGGAAPGLLAAADDSTGWTATSRRLTASSSRPG